MKKLLNKLFGRLTFVVLFMLIQIFAIVAVLSFFYEHFLAIYAAGAAAALVLTVYILNKDSNPAYKIAWLIPILAFPAFGVPLYLMFGRTKLSRRQRRFFDPVAGCRARYAPALGSALEDLKKADPGAALQAAFIQNAACAPVYAGSRAVYLKSGEIYYARLVEALERAERFIFLEYFIIQEGQMWNRVLDILEAKAARGLDVRVLYDDLGCITKLPDDYCDRLGKKGIACHAFMRFKPVLTGRFQNRDHRKLCVVDGNIAFTGGVNFADEYINVRERFGHWRDSGVSVTGAAAWSFTVMFLSMWDSVYPARDDFSRFLPTLPDDPAEPGFVQPFGIAPADAESVGERAYLNMIARAERYVYITTPYLILDNETVTVLETAAQSGVDVRIITPSIPDKKLVHVVTRSYYAGLVNAGIRLYEYAPGFIHSKNFVCDDRFAVCGTINLDYRSLFLLHECAVWLCDAPAVADIRDDFVDTLRDCVEITRDACDAVPWHRKILSSLLRVFAPLM